MERPNEHKTDLWLSMTFSFDSIVVVYVELPCELSKKKSLKIPKGQSETVYRRRTDNTMAKRKRTKGQTTIDKTYR
jgi:hypothetical protein